MERDSVAVPTRADSVAREAQVIAERLVMHHIGTDCLVTYRALANDIAAAISPAPVEGEALGWSREFPVTDGWYWVRKKIGDGFAVIVMEFTEGGLFHTGCETDSASEYQDADFLGPITPETPVDPAPVDAEAMRRVCVDAIPTSWLDSLLSGPDEVLGDRPWVDSDIERLLSAIKARIESLEIGGAAEKEK